MVERPLAELSMKWLDCRDDVCLDESAHPVLLNDHVYTRGSIGANDRPLKYSIHANSWSPLPIPPGLNVGTCTRSYVLATYNNRLLWIGAHIMQDHVPIPSRSVFAYSEADSIWKQDGTIPDLPTEFQLSDLSASSESGSSYLAVALQGDDNQIKLFVFNGKEWKIAEGPQQQYRRRSSVDILLNNGVVYLLDHGRPSRLYSISVKSICSDLVEWTPATPETNSEELTNLTVFDGYPTVFSRIPPRLLILAFVSSSNKWIILGEIEFQSPYKPCLSIVGLSMSSGKLLMMGPNPSKLVGGFPRFDICELSVKGMYTKINSIKIIGGLQNGNRVNR